MSDLRDQLRKAGLVSDKQVRRAKHEERVHASQVGHEGLEAERRAEEARLRAEAEERRRADKARAEEQKRRQEETEAHDRLAALIRGGWIREATAGSRRFFFETRTGRITFLDLSDTAVRRLSMGRAAIVETCGIVRGEFCVVTDKAATGIRQAQPEIIRLWGSASEGA
jgi:uncharacterized protein YaiL (DUF2058 family)